MTVELVSFIFIGFSPLETVTVACYFILFVAISTVYVLELVLPLCSCRVAQSLIVCGSKRPLVNIGHPAAGSISSSFIT
jgi:hypothetical protein